MFLAESQSTKETLKLADVIAPQKMTILLVGEPGVGRHSLARYVHAKSSVPGPFVSANLAVSAEEADNLLFGDLPPRPKSEQQTRARVGLVQSANGGTLFLQNIEEMPPSVQTHFFEFIHTGVVSLLGGPKLLQFDVRIIASASLLLEEYVRSGRFRADLYYRLNVIPIGIPPLRERRDDILPLARHFITSAPTGTRKELSVSAMELLVEYSWPGNIQQLKNVITRACLLSSRSVIDGSDLALDPIRPRPAADQVIVELKTRLDRAEERLATLSALSIVASPIWENRRFNTENELCFVLMPFAGIDDLQKVYGEHIKPTVEKSGMRCIRADDIYDVSGVMQSIWETINKSRVVIAEMTGRNPNVFYELGIAHTLGKPVIMITQSMDDVPSDLRHLRCIKYEYKPRAIERFEDALIKTLTTILQTPPVTLEI